MTSSNDASKVVPFDIEKTVEVCVALYGPAVKVEAFSVDPLAEKSGSMSLPSDENFFDINATGGTTFPNMHDLFDADSRLFQQRRPA